MDPALKALICMVLFLAAFPVLGKLAEIYVNRVEARAASNLLAGPKEPAPAKNYFKRFKQSVINMF
jgi:hypothetical protein